MPRTFEADPKWQPRGAAEHYASERFRDGGAALRDPRRIARLLARHLPAGLDARVLDVPCGTGRLRSSLGAHGRTYVGADRSVEMLSSWPPTDAAPRVLASIAALPFADASFDAVVCCRLLHHLDEARELPAAVAELVRVTRDLVVASFWDASSWPAWRRRRGLRRDDSGRRAIEKRRLASTFTDVGADVVAWAHSFRFVSQQAFLVARRRS